MNLSEFFLRIRNTVDVGMLVNSEMRVWLKPNPSGPFNTFRIYLIYPKDEILLKLSEKSIRRVAQIVHL